MGNRWAITTEEQQNAQKRMRDCDGCHDPKNAPTFAVFVKVGEAGGGGVSESVFMICRKCAARPIALYLHGKGYCAPGVRSDLELGAAAIVQEPGPEVVEPEVEVIDTREAPDSEPPPRPRARRRPPAPKRPKWMDREPDPPATPAPAALDHCAGCGHERGFHPNGPCNAPNYGRGCYCRGFVEK